MAQMVAQGLAGNRRESSRGIFFSSDGSQDFQAGQMRPVFMSGFWAYLKLGPVLPSANAMAPDVGLVPLQFPNVQYHFRASGVIVSSTFFFSRITTTLEGLPILMPFKAAV